MAHPCNIIQTRKNLLAAAEFSNLQEREMQNLHPIMKGKKTLSSSAINRKIRHKFSIIFLFPKRI